MTRTHQTNSKHSKASRIWSSGSKSVIQGHRISKVMFTSRDQKGSKQSKDSYKVTSNSDVDQWNKLFDIAKRTETSSKLGNNQRAPETHRKYHGEQSWRNQERGISYGYRTIIHESGSNFPIRLSDYNKEKLLYSTVNSNTNGGLEQQEPENPRLSGGCTQTIIKKN